MKLYIDDMRSCPHGWTLAKTFEEAIAALETRKVTHVSFDHDLGAEGFDDDGMLVLRKSGYDVAKWLEERVFSDETFPVPTMDVHSSNPSGVLALRAAIGSIERISQKRV